MEENAIHEFQEDGCRKLLLVEKHFLNKKKIFKLCSRMDEDNKTKTVYICSYIHIYYGELRAELIKKNFESEKDAIAEIIKLKFEGKSILFYHIDSIHKKNDLNLSFSRY
jgi:hypothetical protein